MNKYRNTSGLRHYGFLMGVITSLHYTEESGYEELDGSLQCRYIAQWLKGGFPSYNVMPSLYGRMDPNPSRERRGHSAELGLCPPMFFAEKQHPNGERQFTPFT